MNARIYDHIISRSRLLQGRWPLHHALTLLLIVALSVTLMGCATFYAPAIGKTTLNDVTKKLGAPLQKTEIDDGVTRVRWWRSDFSWVSRSGQQITIFLTFYDGEFGQDRVLRRWRAVDNSISLDDSLWIRPPKNLDWSNGYFRFHGKSVQFVDDHRTCALTTFFPDHQYQEFKGILYIGQCSCR